MSAASSRRWHVAASRCGPRRARRGWSRPLTGVASKRVELERDGERLRVGTPLYVVACGAVNSAALLLRSATDRHPNGLANSSGLVGRNYMAHLATMLQGMCWSQNPDEFQKTLAINDFYLRGPSTPYPLGQIQSQGRTHAIEWPRVSVTAGATKPSRCATSRFAPMPPGCRGPTTGWP